MQINNNHKASILIWAIFLSIMILISFLSISSKINKTLNNNTNNQEYSWENTIFDNNKIFQKTLLYKQNTEVRINNSTTTSFNIKINKWWPLFYSLWVFSWTTFSWSLSNSWIIDNNLSFTWNFTTNYNNGIIYIKNLWWTTSFELTSSNNLIKEYKNNLIIQNIWDKKVIKKEWKVKIFDLWVNNWIDYKKYGFEF